jgi:hypothetical protein
MCQQGEGRVGIRRFLSSRYIIVAMLGSTALLAISGSAAACPNEALRSELHSSQLPDCRAYELVSPPYKEGAFISSAFAVSPSGSSFIAGSLGAFSGTEEDRPVGGGNVQGVAYQFSRNEDTGWSALPLAPPAYRYSSRGMVDASAELSGTLWELGTLEPAQPEGVTDFYIEQPRGTFTEIGPATPSPSVSNLAEYTYLGASADLSHVLFSASPGFRWPFDGTVDAGSTLYEYVGVEQPNETREPSLIGVEGDLGSTALVSQCGTRLGSSSPEEKLSGSMYNAVSSSGNRIFFTAVGKDEAPACVGEAPPVGELFAREELPIVNGELPAAHMQTVAISEPSKEACAACLTSLGLEDATFQGASLDGSKVFFTTEQELLPGAKGENLYEYDFDAPAGEKISRVSIPLLGEAEVQGVARISEDGSHVYFVAKGLLTEAPNGLQDSAVAGEDNLYVYERDALFPNGRIAFVAALSPGDSVDWRHSDERPALASADGNLFVFTSVADLTNEGVSGGESQVFQYDAATGGLLRASIGQGGYDDNDRAPTASSRIVNGFPSSYSYANADSPTSANGVQAAEDGVVFFESPSALTPEALNNQADAVGDLVPNVYEYHAGSVYLLSDGRDTSTVDLIPGVYLAGSDPSGNDVFFFTSNSLVPQDGDTQQDLYDARVGGGFPVPSLPPGCAGEACLGALAPAPALAPLGGSATQVAESESASVLSKTPTVTQSPKAKSKPKAKPKRKAKSKRKTKPKLKAKAISKAGLHTRARSVTDLAMERTLR